MHRASEPLLADQWVSGEGGPFRLCSMCQFGTELAAPSVSIQEDSVASMNFVMALDRDHSGSNIDIGECLQERRTDRVRS